MQWIITLITACYIATTVKNFEIQDSFLDVFRRYRDEAKSKFCMFPLHPVDGKYFVVTEVHAKPGDIFKHLSLLLYETERDNHIVKIKLLECALGKWTSRPVEIGKDETDFDVNSHLVFPAVSEKWSGTLTINFNIDEPIQHFQKHTEQTTLCSLPSYSKDASYVVVNNLTAKPGDVLQSAHLVYSCPLHKNLVGDKDILCINNVWSGVIPKCEDAFVHPGLALAKGNKTSSEDRGTAFITETSTTLSLGPSSTTETNVQDPVFHLTPVLRKENNALKDNGEALLIMETTTFISLGPLSTTENNKQVIRRITGKNKEAKGAELIEDISTAISLESSVERITNKNIEQAAVILSSVTEEGNNIKLDEGSTSKNDSTIMTLYRLGASSAENNNTVQETKCTKDGQVGVCRPIAECDSVKREWAMNIQPQLCYFQGSQPLVCCTYDVPRLDVPSVATPMPTELQTSTDYTPPEYDYGSPDNISPDGCEQIPPRLTSQRTGRKAWDKCIEYQEKYVYVCKKKGIALGENNIRENHCGHNTDGIEDTGLRSKPGEFPHMVQFGFRKTKRLEVTSDIHWFCGGSIISEKFVLTSATCARIRQNISVKFVRTAMSRRSEPLDLERLHKVAKVIIHPDHKPPEPYNDIGLLETETRMVLDQLAVPACLPVGNSYNDSVAVAIGFGSTTFDGNSSDSLQKVVLTKFSHDECAKEYPPAKRFTKGIVNNIQICYGDKFVSKDTCQGDGGGPLSIHNKEVHCMYTVIGIVSFGRKCGLIGVPGVYTGVAAYTSWIESQVWPE